MNPDSPSLEPEPTPQPDIRGRVRLGAKLTGAIAVIGKISSLASTVVLGLLLSENDYGLYAIATALTAMTTLLRDAGAGRLLIQRHADYDRLAGPVWKLAIASNALAALFLVAAGVIAASAKNSPALVWMLSILAVSTMVRSGTIVYRARATSLMSFHLLWRIDLSVLLGRQGLMIVLALLGAGPLSFVIPVLITDVYEALALRSAIGKIPPGPLTRSAFTEIFGATKWIMFGAGGAALVLQGDYFSLMVLEDAATLGFYFFGFSLAASVSTVFTVGIRNVLTPALTHLAHDSKRMRSALKQSMAVMSTLLSFVGMFGAVVSPALIHLIWRGKWDLAIPAASVVFATFMFRSVGVLLTAVMEARGLWRMRALVLWLDAIGTVSTAAIGAWLGGLVAIPVCVGIYRSVVGVSLSFLASRFSFGTTSDVFAALGPGTIVGSLAAGVGLLSIWLSNVPITSLNGGLTAGSAFCLVYAAGAALSMRPQILQLASLVQRSKKPKLP